MPPHDLLARVGQICLEQRQKLEAGPEKVSHRGNTAFVSQLLSLMLGELQC
jgi:hypothetical protein